MPGILAIAFMAFAIPVLVIEGTGVPTALRRGIRLASTRLGPLLSLYAVVLLVPGVAFFAAIYVAARIDWPWSVSIITFWVSFVVLASSLIMAASTVVGQLYWDVCEHQKELDY
jgi:hypothetical protein